MKIWKKVLHGFKNGVFMRKKEIFIKIRTFSTLFLLSIIVFFLSSKQIQSQGLIKVLETMNIRTEPINETNSKILSVISTDEVYMVIQKKNNWLNIELNNNTSAWVKMSKERISYKKFNESYFSIKKNDLIKSVTKINNNKYLIKLSEFEDLINFPIHIYSIVKGGNGFSRNKLNLQGPVILRHVQFLGLLDYSHEPIIKFCEYYYDLVKSLF